MSGDMRAHLLLVATSSGLLSVLALGCGSGDGESTGASRSSVSTRQGVDYAWARPSPQALAAAGYTFACRYLSHDTTGKNLSASEAQTLRAAGVDVVANWEESATAALNGFAQGVSDAQAADAQANADGIPAGRPIYFSIDFDAQPGDQGAIDAYFDGVASVIGRDRTGAYGGFGVIQRLFDDGKITFGWQTYAWSGGQWDGRAQLRQVQNDVTIPGACGPGSCDADEAVADDFGQWGHASSPQYSSYYYRGMARDATGGGYWIVGSDGGVFTFGDAGFHGSMGGQRLAAPVAAMASTRSGAGYWLVARDGGIFTFGDAGFHGSMGGQHLDAPVVGMASTPSGGGYWLVASDGGVFTFGDAGFHGSMGGQHLNAPVVGMASTPSGGGYWLVAADGGIFTFGDAAFYGSMGGQRLAAPVVGMASSPSGRGYWLVAGDGGIFTFGDAAFHGSMGGRHLNAPVLGMAATPTGGGYWLVAGDGGIFTFGDARFEGSRG